MRDPDARPVSPHDAFRLAAQRNSPLSVVRPEEMGLAPMARGRFLEPDGDTVTIENLQIPGRAVTLRAGHPIEAFFQHDGDVYQFRSRIVRMDTPVRLNEATVVRGMTIAAPTRIEKGNRRNIYRQSFASLNPPVDVQVWPVPLAMLTPEQCELIGHTPETSAPTPQPKPDDAEPAPEPGVEAGAEPPARRALAPSQTLFEPIAGLTLGQVRPVLDTEPAWAGEVTDASEFGLGFTVLRVVYTRLKIFQPLVVGFRLPGVDTPMRFLFEVRRVQALNRTDARLGGMMLINAGDHAEVFATRELARFTLELQRDRARRLREAG